MNAMTTGVACPRDGAQLVEVERDGVMIDTCPTCRGIWLDGGELEKLVAHENGEPGGKRKRGGFLQNLLEFGGD